MKKAFLRVLKVIIFFMFAIILGIGLMIFIGALSEEIPGHPLDFQDIDDISLPKSIHSVKDGLPYALNRAYEWRKDAVLTGVEIVSVGEEEIKNKNGKLHYTFECDYINNSKPSGIMFVSISIESNSIEFVDASHDGNHYTRKFEELKTNDLTEKINRVYDVAIKDIEKDTILKYEHPFVRVYIDSEFATFEVSADPKRNMIKHRIKIDMKTYEILSKNEKI